MPDTLLHQRLAQELAPVNAALGRAAQRLPEPVRPVARHILEAGGKRLRPFLTVLMARLLGDRGQRIYDLAVTMEMLHAATLLHDDVLDDAANRRGKPAAHTRFGVAQTILAGDALLAGANAQVADFGDPRLCRCFSTATSETAAGEILEIAAQHRVDVSAEEYAAIVRGKTAALIAASCELGALAAGAAPDAVAAAAAYGENLGMAFQIVDDALDFAPEAETGKPTGGDVREGKLTPPLRLYRLQLSENERAAFDAAFVCGMMSEADASGISARVRAGGFDRQAREEAGTYLETARAALLLLPDAPERRVLQEMTDYVRDRSH